GGIEDGAALAARPDEDRSVPALAPKALVARVHHGVRAASSPERRHGGPPVGGGDRIVPVRDLEGRGLYRSASRATGHEQDRQGETRLLGHRDPLGSIPPRGVARGTSAAGTLDAP